MGSVVNALPPQTLYVTVRRDELRQLKAEREQLLNEVAHLRQQLQAQRGEGQPARMPIRSLD
ncbi:hypothetical protein C1886_17175 [Pseudomonas sp. FW300-N1A1]|uniref:DUF6026 family protein n=1 Tax=Pseudomonas sp. FW300-N1A1 TaxID=2075555 RepID=UPI000CD196D3|nr:DUF6026 family protein [Pseudomonas sp. FW300-N1A1]POA18363.1 hypothetical protein C1886_17175 [Pseudomonas sp. FW300-N1A1]